MFAEGFKVHGVIAHPVATVTFDDVGCDDEHEGFEDAVAAGLGDLEVKEEVFLNGGTTAPELRLVSLERLLDGDEVFRRPPFGGQLGGTDLEGHAGFHEGGEVVFFNLQDVGNEPFEGGNP